MRRAGTSTVIPPLRWSSCGRRWRRSCLVLFIGAPLEGSQYLGLVLPQPSLGIEFAHDGARPELDRYHVHIEACYVTWRQESIAVRTSADRVKQP
jgi:hypothetical protein